MSYGGVWPTQGLVIAMQQYGRQHVIDLLNQLGYTELAEEASRDLPDPVDTEQIWTWGEQHDLSLDDLTGQMGGSP